MTSAVLFDRHDVKRCDRNATIVIEPHYDSTAPWVNTGMIWAANRVAVSTAHDDGERLKRRGRKVLSNIRDHAENPSIDSILRQMCSGSNETELSHRYRRRGSLAGVRFWSGKMNLLAGRSLALANPFGVGCIVWLGFS